VALSDAASRVEGSGDAVAAIDITTRKVGTVGLRYRRDQQHGDGDRYPPCEGDVEFHCRSASPGRGLPSPGGLIGNVTTEIGSSGVRGRNPPPRPARSAAASQCETCRRVASGQGNRVVVLNRAGAVVGNVDDDDLDVDPDADEGDDGSVGDNE
jgi:hypothetical protein